MTGREFDLHWKSFDLNKAKRKFNDWLSSIFKDCFLFKCGSSSDGRASAFQAEGRGFDPRFPLHCDKIILLIYLLIYSASLSF
jgi:hypothetical protein